jgi:hypothetical protein
MAIYSNPSFPILASDQADVIRLFIDLMRDANRVSSAPQIGSHQPSRSAQQDHGLADSGRDA